MSDEQVNAIIQIKLEINKFLTVEEEGKGVRAEKIAKENVWNKGAKPKFKTVQSGKVMADSDSSIESSSDTPDVQSSKKSSSETSQEEKGNKNNAILKIMRKIDNRKVPNHEIFNEESGREIFGIF